MIRRFSVLFIFQCCLFSIVGFSQTTGVDLPKVIGPSPSVAAIQKYGEYQVGTYTGVPNISIPLYTINLKDISIPISIAYHAAGIKVGEEASRIGLGWSLQAGGTISRNVMGLDDLTTNALAPNSFDLIGTPTKYMIPSLFLPFGANTYDLSWKLGATIDPANPNVWADFEPDVFYCNFLGNAGKFVIKKKDTSAIFEDPSSNMKVKFLFSATVPPYSGLSQSCQIIATGSDGTKYYFDQFEYSETAGPQTVPNRITAWYLTKVQTSNNAVVTFNYLTNNSGYTVTLNSPSEYVLDIGGSHRNIVKNIQPHNKYNNLLLSSIDFSGGSVSFNYDDRVDVQGDKRLTSVTVVNTKGAIIKKINLIQDYFTANASPVNTIDLGTSLWGNAQLDSNWIIKRLKLTQVQEQSGDGTTVLSHSFDYDETLLPLKNSTSRDHWGYFNNAANGNNLIPGLTWAYPGLTRRSLPPVYTCTPNFENDFSNSNVEYLESPYKYYTSRTGANREVDPNYSQSFMLKKIVYPTGGTTRFTYEQNTYDPDKSFELDQNAELYNFSEAKQDFVSMMGVAYMPANYSQTFSFTVSAADVLPGETTALINMKFKARFQSASSSANTTLTFVRLKNGAGTVIHELSFNAFAGLINEGGNMYSLDFPLQKLGPGSYSIEVKLGGNTVDKSCLTYTVSGSWNKSTKLTGDGVRYKYAGGLRIKNISSYTFENEISSSVNYRYHFQMDSDQNGLMETYSTGKIMDRPVYFTSQFDLEKQRVALQSEASVSGNIGYDSVVTEQNNIKHLDVYYNKPYRTTKYKWYTYSSTELFPGYFLFPGIQMSGMGLPNDQLHLDIYFDYKPAGLKNFQDNANGKLTRSVDYLFTPETSQYSVLKQVDNNYSGTGNGTNGIVWADRVMVGPNGVGIVNNSGQVTGLCLVGLPMMYGVTNMIYPVLRSQSILLTQSVEKLFSVSGSISTTTDYIYNSKDLLKKKTGYKSNGEILTTEFKYPNDFAGISPYSSMIEKNIITPVIEQSTFKNTTFLQSGKTNYKDWGNGIIASETVESKQLNNPSEIRVRYHGYDDKGNILSVSKEGDVNTSYIWDYNGQIPIAQVAGGGSNQIAYTSFEAEGMGGWEINPGSIIDATKSLNGTKSFSGAIRKPVPTGNYSVTLWANTGGFATVNGQSGTPGVTRGIWQLFTWNLTNVSSVEIASANMDEVRLFPQGAQMTTYTYEPLVGMTSQSDANNRITYYEYDSFGRLKLIRDENKNVLKTFDYQYQKNQNQ
jgi:YD repeat-containing protein